MALYRIVLVTQQASSGNYKVSTTESGVLFQKHNLTRKIHSSASRVSGCLRPTFWAKRKSTMTYSPFWRVTEVLWGIISCSRFYYWQIGIPSSGYECHLWGSLKLKHISTRIFWIWVKSDSNVVSRRISNPGFLGLLKEEGEVLWEGVVSVCVPVGWSREGVLMPLFTSVLDVHRGHHYAHSLRGLHACVCVR